ncbi:MAG: hypothetical protein IPJ40_12610 [Saprospirales bacterium]|nr:hypothetical protein [Saprospirales bacterium]
MFSREKIHWGPYAVHRHIDPESKSGFSVVPERGACLTELRFRGISVLDGYQNADELDTLDWGKSALLAPFPNRLKDGCYRVGEEMYQFPLNEGERGNALHGFVMDKPFELVKEEDGRMELAYHYGGNFFYYPFPFVMRVVYAMNPVTGFEISLELENTGAQPMPAGFGWHPYFQLGVPVNSVTLKLPAVRRIEVDARMIPTGEKAIFSGFQSPEKIGQAQFDTGFLLQEPGSRAEVSLQFETLHLRYWQESVFPFLQVFIPPARQSIALEPMTCNIDAFNNGEGLQMLAPGARLGGKAGIMILE